MKKWFLDPPCDAELLLEKLFREKNVTKEDTPSKIQKQYPLFHDFSSAVFRNHFKRHSNLNGFALREYILFYLLYGFSNIHFVKI